MLEIKKFSLILLALGICAGAFGAHALKGSVTPERLEVFSTASYYQMIMSLALLVLAKEAQIKLWTLRLLAFGIIVFSFSLYFLVILDYSKLGIITPIGGISMILAITFAALQIKSTN
jgi:uncharacterized membrane protein YgdD (TMEM256/DUF423 family)